MIDAFEMDVDKYAEEKESYFNPTQATEDFAYFLNNVFLKSGSPKRLTESDFTVVVERENLMEGVSSAGKISLGGLEIADYTTGEDDMYVDLHINKENLKTVLEKMLKS